ncbi:RNA methyltransferase [Thiohalorhabdus sp.]|uniref:RNA methyltransferase n=1 Tax=Thiohalorhabdus sp. TaxID=3094134 RepID=UPI002FC3C38A
MTDDAQGTGNPAVVLVAARHPGNIGATARAMKTMGLTRLMLVTPAHFPHAEASARASGASDILAGAEVFPDLGAALADIDWVVGTTARSREISLPVRSPDQAARELADQAGSGRLGALVFGRESHGLRNDELDRCDRLVHIPTAPDYSSLNLAHAVQILVYEVHRVSAAATPSQGPREVPAGGRVLEDLFRHWERVVQDVAFMDPQNPERTFRRFRRLILRAAPTEGEVRFLRGFLSAIDKRIHGPRHRSATGKQKPEEGGGES